MAEQAEEMSFGIVYLQIWEPSFKRIWKQTQRLIQSEI